MNDRHRTRERYRKKCLRKKYSFLSDLGVKTALLIEQSYNMMLNTVQAVFDALYKFIEDIKAMPEDEFEKLLEEHGSQFTPEQIAILRKIRGDESDDRTNNPT